MRIFVTGASGWIGSAVLPELLGAGHEVLGLARSDSSAAAVEKLGAEVHRGSLDDLDSLRAGAQAADGVVHLGYNHDFSDMAGAAVTDRAAIEVFADVLDGSGGPLLIASGTLGLRPGGVGTEDDVPDAGGHPRIANAAFTTSLKDRGIRSIVSRFSPTVHGDGDQGFVPVLIGVAREKGFAAYIDGGENRWPAVHRLDAGKLVQLAVDQAEPGTVIHAVAEEGITSKAIAEAIGAGLGVPVKSIPAADAAEHFGWIGMFFGMDAPASNALTRSRFDWNPTHPGLIADLAEGHYFEQ